MLLLVMPITEQLCNWDRFLRGGPDVEFSLLAGLLFAAMVVLSMNGTMLQPRMLRISKLQPGRIEPAPATRAASLYANATPGMPGRSGSSQSSASKHFLSRWREEAASAFDSGNGSRVFLPMRI
jgi:hypothetical protein